MSYDTCRWFYEREVAKDAEIERLTLRTNELQGKLASAESQIRVLLSQNARQANELEKLRSKGLSF
jgi:hypothetical protein